MSEDHRQRMIQLLTTGGAAFRSSEVKRAHDFRDALLAAEPTFYEHLYRAMLGGKQVRAKYEDEGVVASESFKLGVTFSHEVTVEGATYFGCAYALTMEGKDLSGNISLERRTGDGPKVQTDWKVATNETWPTMVIPFTRRGKSLGAKLHLAELKKVLAEEDLQVSPAALVEVFAPIDARLQRVRRAIRGK